MILNTIVINQRKLNLYNNHINNLKLILSIWISLKKSGINKI